MIEPVNAEEYTTQQTRRSPAQFEFVKLHIDKGVARITLHRPEHNLLNEAMLREIADGIAFAGDRDDAKLIVLDSACKVFCGGIDIGEYTSQRVFQMLDAFHAAFAGMLEVGKPVICVVNGPATERTNGADELWSSNFVPVTSRFAASSELLRSS